MILVNLKEAKWKTVPNLSFEDALYLDQFSNGFPICYCKTHNEVENVINYLNLLMFTLIVYYNNENAQYSSDFRICEKVNFSWGSLYDYFDDISNYQINTMLNLDLLNNFPELNYISRKFYNNNNGIKTNIGFLYENVPSKIYRLIFIELLETSAKNNRYIQNVYRNICTYFNNNHTIKKSELTSINYNYLANKQKSSEENDQITDNEFLQSIGFTEEEINRMSEYNLITFDGNDFVISQNLNIETEDNSIKEVEYEEPKSTPNIDNSLTFNTSPVVFLTDIDFLNDYITFCKVHSLGNIASSVTRLLDKVNLNFFTTHNINEIKQVSI